jgi:hypothetical protein
MASTYDFALTGAPAITHQAVSEALVAAGYRLSALQDGTVAVERGSGTKTFWLGAFAGKDFHAKFSLQFFDGEAGTTARFTRVGSLGALKGGAIGHSKTTDIFHEAARAIDAHVRAAGILANVTEHA